MSVRSMTGFARVRKQFDEGEIVLSLKSVNHRGLDLHFRMPQELDPLESDVRALLKAGVARGHVQIHVQCTRTTAAAAAPVNLQILDAYMQAFQKASQAYGLDGKPDLNAMLQLPGVLAASEEHEPGESLAKALLDAASEAIAALNAFREREGAATAKEITQRCETLRKLAVRMGEIREGAIPAFQKRLREKLDDLLQGAGVEPQRLAQEAAILADRSDISEELVRLDTHALEVEKIIGSGGEAGKRLDFLLQEMNRESNTILSKTGGLGDLGLTMTELGLSAKAEIDKIREQSLNLE
ncbi:MAG TPA: YicC/YloC family endoribonuclease [Verrucomicrobiae bacterium]|nr:YicC/YloC family endoribonuclease [Verrucomicrobiae bacterium]